MAVDSGAVCSRDAVVAAVHAVFADADPTAALAVLDLYGVEAWERERERVHLAIIELSAGSREKLAELVRVAKADYRDVLAWHEQGPLPEAEGRKLEQAARAILQKWGRR